MNVTTVYPKVAAIVADVLAIDESDIALDKTLVADLGAESIDFLDLVFQLEREFSVKMPRGQLEKEARAAVTDGEFDNNGILTEAGLATLKSFLPEIPEVAFKAGLTVNEIPALFTVETFCKFVIKAQQTQTA